MACNFCLQSENHKEEDDFDAAGPAGCRNRRWSTVERHGRLRRGKTKVADSPTIDRINSTIQPCGPKPRSTSPGTGSSGWKSLNPKIPTMT
mmetsp:Transcript_43989/g.94763  ORF Transcript_43989/g.94763 Transcript_43989/m.94763 type:complete len:91 (-) Transcript_43989:1032-1304(-)